MTKEIKLRNSDLSFKVDDDVYEFMNSFNWYLSKNGYPMATITAQKMIMPNIPEGMVRDHIDGDKLNNLGSNLRIGTRENNSHNAKANSDNKYSKYKGVSFNNNKFHAAISYKGKTYSIGVFDDEVIAAKAYDQLARHLHKEFARLNFPDIDEEIVKIEKVLDFKSSTSSKYFNVIKNRDNGKYMSKVRNKEGKQVQIGTFDDEVVSAIVSDKYVLENNLKSKLNFPNDIEKTLNFKVPSVKTSKYFGISKKQEGIYVANIWTEGKNMYLGSFKYETEAAVFREKYIIKNNLKLKLNFPEKFEEFKKEIELEDE